MENEKKKMKVWKILLIIVAIILLLFIILTLRKMIILNSLDAKVSELQSKDNIYAKIQSNSERMNSQLIQAYVKDGVTKYIVENERTDGSINKMIQITYPNERKVYIDNGITKTMSSYKENNNNSSFSIIANYADSYTLSEKLINAITSSIKTVEINGKKCYEISGLYNSNLLYEQGTEKMLIYIEKDTGLPVKRIEIVNDNGNLKEYIATYEYKFDCVTDKDMKEPDSSEYKAQ